LKRGDQQMLQPRGELTDIYYWHDVVNPMVDEARGIEEISQIYGI
jgi:hypothetical protein